MEALREPLHKPFTFCDNYRTAGVSHVHYTSKSRRSRLNFNKYPSIFETYVFYYSPQYAAQLAAVFGCAALISHIIIVSRGRKFRDFGWKVLVGFICANGQSTSTSASSFSLFLSVIFEMLTTLLSGALFFGIRHYSHLPNHHASIHPQISQPDRHLPTWHQSRFCFCPFSNFLGYRYRARHCTVNGWRTGC